MGRAYTLRVWPLGSVLGNDGSIFIIRGERPAGPGGNCADDFRAGEPGNANLQIGSSERADLEIGVPGQRYIK